MKEIQTWHERAMAHPDHQSGMVSEGMIRARMCEEIADLRAEVERLTRERYEARAEVERLRAQIVSLEATGAEASDEIDRLRAALEVTSLGSEVLASYQGSAGREWHSGGAWLYPGDTINVVRAPLPEIEAKP